MLSAHNAKQPLLVLRESSRLVGQLQPKQRITIIISVSYHTDLQLQLFGMVICTA